MDGSILNEQNKDILFSDYRQKNNNKNRVTNDCYTVFMICYRMYAVFADRIGLLFFIPHFRD